MRVEALICTSTSPAAVLTKQLVFHLIMLQTLSAIKVHALERSHHPHPNGHDDDDERERSW